MTFLIVAALVALFVMPRVLLTGTLALCLAAMLVAICASSVVRPRTA